MTRIMTYLLSALLIAISTVAAHAEFTAKTVYDFLDAQAAVYTEGTPESVEAFVAFLDDDIKDYHMAYDREFSGKDHFRKNMPNKAKALQSYERHIMSIEMGTNVAIATYFERTQEEKKGGRISNYAGRTIMVIEYNDDGLITALRRYMD